MWISLTDSTAERETAKNSFCTHLLPFYSIILTWTQHQRSTSCSRFKATRAFGAVRPSSTARDDSMTTTVAGNLHTISKSSSKGLSPRCLNTGEKAWQH
jgi:hypothetical protein